MIRTRILSTALAIGALGACASCLRKEPAAPPPVRPGAAEARPGEFTVVVSGALVGHLEPCGCSPDQRGGVGRAAASVEAIAAEGRPLVVLDAGDRFFASAEPAADPLVAAQHEREALAMAEVTRAIGYDAVGLGTRDAAHTAFLSTARLPALVGTESPSLSLVKPWLVRQLAGVRVGVVWITDEESLAKHVKGARADGAKVVLGLAYRTFAETRRLVPAAKAAGVDFLVAARAEVPETTDSAASTGESPPVFQVAARGEALLRLDVTANGVATQAFAPISGLAQREEELNVMQARIDLMRADVMSLGPGDPMYELKTKKMLELEERRAKLAASPPPALPANANAYSYAFVPMSPKLPQEPKVRALIDAYNEETGRANFEYAKAHPKACPPKQKGVDHFVGTEGCVDCHVEAFDFWQTTKHSHAYASLVEKHRQYDAACVGCHVTGYEKAGGACDLAQVEARENVQCEACHGPGSLHAADGDEDLVKKPDGDKPCLKCHDPENSPHFQYEVYRKRIIGPGHGAPMSKTRQPTPPKE